MENLLITVVVSVLLLGGVNSMYYGKLISNGWGANPSHDLAGDIYAVDESSFRIIGFTYDGNAPAAFFYLGTDKSYSEVSSVGKDSTAIKISGPNGKLERLGVFQNENILLKLPEGRKLSEFTYISVWCEAVDVFFGGVDIPSDFDAPKPQSLGQITSFGHDVSSGDITVLTDRTISIKNLKYDGAGPDAFFYVGITEDVKLQQEPYGIIPDENGSKGVLPAYTGKDIILTLPSALSFRDLKWLSIWCRQFDENFGEIRFPANLNVPPALQVSIDRGQMNCEPLSDNLQVAWMVTDDSIMFELAGNIDRNTDYMAFGLSGSDSGILMVGSDVVVTDFKDGGDPRAIDYYISAYAQCSTNGGVCPDTKVTGSNGTDDVMEVAGEITDGITRISYKRKLQTAENDNDKVYKTDGPQQIVWSIGPLNTNDEAGKHYSDGRITAANPIDFGRTVANNCPAFSTGAKVEKPDFKPHHLYGNKGRTTFTAEIGQSGSEQGYLALTGNPSWGIAWYINGTLIPELHLMRGTTYTFRVAGGEDPNNGAQYHPFYFTSSSEGGFSKTQDPDEMIYPGKINGEDENFATGVYCEWKPTMQSIVAAQNGAVAACFEEYKMDLQLKCNDDNRNYTDFLFTPGSDTPETIFYQCYTHKNLGWKIHVYDEADFPAEEIVTEDCTINSAHTAAPAMIIILLTYVFGCLV